MEIVEASTDISTCEPEVHSARRYAEPSKQLQAVGEGLLHPLLSVETQLPLNSFSDPSPESHDMTSIFRPENYDNLD